MTYQTTVTKKGQITIPKEFRDRLRLDKIRKVLVELSPGGKSVQVKPSVDFLAAAKAIKLKKPVSVLVARGNLEKNYGGR